MARNQSIESKFLENSMNGQCICLNAKEKQYLRFIIDEKDDVRRKEFRRNIKEKILDIFEALENENIHQSKKSVIKLEAFLQREFEKEDYLENLDDENRENINKYLNQSIEEFRQYNSEIEKEILEKK